MEKAKENIKKLVEKYNRLKEEDKINSYNEAQTRKDFIDPLLEFLGWDMRNLKSDNEVTTEEKISKDRVDLAFRINGIPKFFLEAKSLKSDLDNESYARQAINYSWNKGVTWAVLTDFESVKIYNAQAQSKLLSDKLVFEIPHSEYLSDFNRLWLLSKESFEKNELDKYAEKHAKKIKKQTVNEKLYSDLKLARETLTKSFKLWNGKINQELLDEGVQRILDRLIFIRVAEDKKLEPPILRPLINQWKKGDGQEQIFQQLTGTFREFDKTYNSNLFTEHPCEKWKEYDDSIKKVIEMFYGTDMYEYDFKNIPADILGGVYENYLGYIAQKPIEIDAEGKSGKLLRIEDKKEIKLKSRKKRKEQGIYYTPKFIVDYIVKNTLGEKLSEVKGVHELKQIRVLDPACGSGSFLTKALETINDKYKNFGYRGDQNNKSEILLSNIYGVDLDPQAVELARLNLLIDALDKKEKLPNLTENIRVGNSLISGTEAELEKYFGKNYQAKKPFNWGEEFSGVFKNPLDKGGAGGFDVIIGNPPYVRNRNLDDNDKELFNEKYVSASGQYDIYQLFFEKSINLLKENGFLGFITSNKYAIADYGKKLREFILENCKIVSIVDVSNMQVFKDASTYPYIIILQKTKNNSGNIIKGYKADNELNLEDGALRIKQDDIKTSETKNFVIKEESKLLKGIEVKSIKLGEVATIKETIHTGNVRSKLIVDSRIDENCKKLLAGKDCHRYWFKWGGKYIRYDKSLIDKKKGEYGNLIEEKYFNNPKIFLREIASKIECCFDDEKYFSLNKVYSVQSNGEYNLKYLLALLNSSALSFYFRNKFEEAHVMNGYLQFKKIYTSQIPIYKIDFQNKAEKQRHDELSELAERITNLNKQLQKVAENSDKWNSIKKEIEKTDKEIDQKVYKLYGLTEEEIKIVESS